MTHKNQKRSELYQTLPFSHKVISFIFILLFFPLCSTAVLNVLFIKTAVERLIGDAPNLNRSFL